MTTFKPRKCVCGLDTRGKEIAPNPAGDFFCPRCGRDLTPVGPPEPEEKEEETEPEPEPEPEPEEKEEETEPEPEPEPEPETEPETEPGEEQPPS